MLTHTKSYVDGNQSGMGRRSNRRVFFMKLNRLVALSVAITGCVIWTGCTDAQSTADQVQEHQFGDGNVSSFYDAPPLASSSPGQLLKAELLDAGKLPTSSSEGYRLMYVSRSGVQAPVPIAVSGEIFFPKARMPAGGWPVVAWEHGTTGIADVCAPSWRGFSTRDKTYLNRWLDEGFAVVATDYQGLGTSGPHPYLLYRPEGYSALDGTLAALGAYKGRLRNQIILVGQSQGSGAALGAAWLAPAYAPHLNILGVVATGLVVDFTVPPNAPHQPLPVEYGDAKSLAAAFAMLEIEGTDQSLHPDIDVRSVMTPQGVILSKIARRGCLIDLMKATAKSQLETKDLFSKSINVLESGKWDATHIPNAAIKVPIFAGTGLADTEASLPGQYNAVAAMCDAGTKVTWMKYPGLTHNGALNGSFADSMAFVRALMAGHPSGAICQSVVATGPPQQATPGIPFNN